MVVDDEVDEVVHTNDTMLVIIDDDEVEDEDEALALTIVDEIDTVEH